MCVIEPACVLKKALHKALAAFFDVLGEYTLADLLKPGRTLSQLLAVAST
jgi:Rrf2 family nitric oxide-sensitive transcriptional repressor